MISKKSTKKKSSKRKNPSHRLIEEFLNKEIIMNFSFGKNKTHGYIIGKLFRDGDLYYIGVNSSEFWFSVKDLIQIGYDNNNRLVGYLMG